MKAAVAGLVFAAVVLALQAGELSAEVKSHPILTPYPGSQLQPGRFDQQDFAKFDFIAGPGSPESGFDLVPLEGRFTRIGYINPKGRSVLEILSNYADAVAKAGFEVKFRCESEGCGPDHGKLNWEKVNGTVSPRTGGYFAAYRKDESGETYVAVSVIKNRHQVTVLEIGAMETGLVSVKAEALASDLDRAGRVTVPGIFFDTSKATITAESGPALAEMAKLLSIRPELKVWVVGHTDWVGSLEANMALSDARARAVVAALVSDYGVDQARLAGMGVGPLSPAATNDSDDGRAANRRVELVVRP